MKTVIVDVDSILWDFHNHFWELSIKENMNIPKPKYWSKWDFWEGYLTEKSFYDIVDIVHTNQINYKPFVYAGKVLELLHKKGYYIIIASHRRSNQFRTLQKWLEINDLYYDELHISYDKTKLFNEDVKLIIDDCPSTILHSINIGKKCLSICYPWNKILKKELGTNMKDNLKEIYDSIKKEM
jgi:hypothetical protein